MSRDLLGAVAGPWTVTGVDGQWATVTHRDGSTRVLKSNAAEDLLRGAKVGGLVSVRARASEPPKPIQAIPMYAAGDPTTDI